jgi:N-acetylmuramoyl-L-alanine amidase
MVARMVVLASAFHPDSCVVAEVKASPNHGERKNGGKIDMLVLHYTGMRDARAAVDKLCNPQSEVSAHYVVLEDGHIVQCVPEERRAWHAGQAYWGGDTDINSCSIGIEIANPGHEYGYPDFPKRQVAAIAALCRSIFTRYRILPHRVLAHSDVAPTRKQDPGEKFPWRTLHASGIGAWVRPEPIIATGQLNVLGENGPIIADAQVQLSRYGYATPTSGYFDGATRDAIAAFQRHFRPAKVDGILDFSTLQTLKALNAAREAG